jgi:SAM-dependent methyltransferase
MSEGGALHNNRKRAGSFGDDAEQYDRVRPSYPSEMVSALLIDQPRSVLDVGCGTGIASRLFIGHGREVIGLEPDPRMAAVARRNGVHVEESTIEEWEPAGRRFDLLTAGQSWHWVDPHAGVEKAAEVLHPGGRIGLFWNQAHPGPEVRDVVHSVYDRHAPELGRQSVLLGQRNPLLYESIAEVIRSDGRFREVSLERFDHSKTYPTEAWLDLATTHSDHRTLPPLQLARLLDHLRQEIDGIGGQVPVRYETTLVTARVQPGAPT